LDGIRDDTLSVVTKYPDRDVIKLLEENRAEFGLAVVFSYSQSGYVRLAATENLASIGSQSLPYLLIRSCDWVPNVAEVAAEAALKLIPKVDDRTLQGCVRVLPVLNLYPIWESPVVRALIQEFKTRPGILKSARWSSTVQLATLLIDRHLIGIDEDWLEIARIGLKHSDHRVVQRVVVALKGMSIENKLEILHELLSSSAKGARLAAVDIAEECRLEETLTFLLLDRVWRVRLNARYCREKLGVSDFIVYYRSHLPAVSAIKGFAEVANDSQLEELLPYLDHPNAKVQCAVIRAIGNRNLAHLGPLIALRLKDERPRTIIVAVHVLIKFGYRLTREEVNELLPRIPEVSRAKALALVIELLPRWEFLIAALDLWVEHNLVQDLSATIHRWLTARNRDYSGPTFEQLCRAQAAYRNARFRLYEAASDALEQELDYWQSRIKAP